MLSATDFNILNLNVLLIYIEENFPSLGKLLLSAVSGVNLYLTGVNSWQFSIEY